jgi:hypothetical protein
MATHDALNAIIRLRSQIREAGPAFVRPEAVDPVLELAEQALAEAQTMIWQLKGEAAARDGYEVILTFSAIGAKGVPVNHAEGTILRCTDGPDEWRLTDSRWVPVPK